MPGLVKVITPPVSSQLSTLANAQTECGITGSAQDALLGLLIDRASAAIVRYCGRAFGLQTVQETFRRSNRFFVDPVARHAARRDRPLVLFYDNTQTPSSVTIDAGDPLVADTDYEIDLESALMWRLSLFGQRSRWICSVAIVVEYQTGWTLPNDDAVDGVPTLPADVEQVCLALVRAGFSNQGIDPSVVMDWSPDIGRTQFAPHSSAMSMQIDSGMQAALAGYVLRGYPR